MVKNYMEEIAKMLGVELGEEFIIENADRKETVVLAMNGLHVIQPNNVLGPDHGKLLSKVLQGLYDVVKKPWEPEYRETYYYPCVSDSITQNVVIQTYWLGGTLDYAMKALGMVYRTMEEAEARFADDYKRLTGKELEG